MERDRFQESIKASVEILKAIGDPEDAGQVKLFEEVLRESGDGDPLLPPQTQSSEQILQAEVEARTITKELKEVIRQYNTESPSPGLERELWQKLITTSIREAGPQVIQKINPDKIVVPKCNRSADELEELKAREIGMVYVSEGITYPLLGEIFHKMLTESVNENAPKRVALIEYSRRRLTVVEDVYKGSITGWLNFDMGIDPPNRDTNEEELKDIHLFERRRDGRLITDIWASQKSHFVSGEYIDENHTSSRLPGSHILGNTIAARFNSRGGLKILWSWPMEPHLRDRALGGRSER